MPNYSLEKRLCEFAQTSRDIAEAYGLEYLDVFDEDGNVDIEGLRESVATVRQIVLEDKPDERSVNFINHVAEIAGWLNGYTFASNKPPKPKTIQLGTT